MRWWLVLLAACGDNVDPFTPLQLDVVVAPGAVAIYTGRTDGATAADDGAFVLPALEGCVDDVDTVAATPSCLTDAVLLDGDTVVSDAATFDPPAITVHGTVNAYAAPALALTGCGGSVTIPLDGSPFPTATLQVEDLAVNLDVAAWSGADQAMLTFTGPAGAHRCVTQMVDYTVNVLPVDPPMFQNATVQLLADSTTVEIPFGTTLGTATVHRGGTATTPFPPPPNL